MIIQIGRGAVKIIMSAQFRWASVRTILRAGWRIDRVRCNSLLVCWQVESVACSLENWQSEMFGMLVHWQSVAVSNFSWVLIQALPCAPFNRCKLSVECSNYMTRCKNSVIIKLQLTSFRHSSDYAMGWTNQGSIPGKDKRFYSPLKCPDQLWGPSSGGLVAPPQQVSGENMKMTTQPPPSVKRPIPYLLCVPSLHAHIIFTLYFCSILKCVGTHLIMSVSQMRMIWVGACCTHGGNEKFEQSSGILHCEVLGRAGRTTLQWIIQNWYGGLAELGKNGKQWQADLNTVMLGTSDRLIWTL